MANYSHALTHRVFGVVRDIVTAADQQAFVIGGFVRDMLLERQSKDIDIVVVGSGIELARRVGERFRHAPLTVFRNFGTAMLRLNDAEVEFVGARKESYRADSRNPTVEDGTLEDDQNRRDFTVNALALSLREETFGDLVDPFDGVRDLQARILRTPLTPRATFSDDPLRMMRAVRFASQLNFRIEEATYNGIVESAERIEIVSMERITEELNKIMLSPRPSVGLKLMERTGLMRYILPEIQALKGVEKVGTHAHKDNFYHTMEVVDALASKSDNLWLRWAALLHDIGKPRTKRYDPHGGWTFHNHDWVGQKMTPQVFARLRLPQDDRLRYVQKLVSLHMRPIILSEDIVTDSAVRRLLCDAGDDIDDLMLLCEADVTSKNEQRAERYLRNFKIVRRKLREIEEKDHVRNFQPPITGDIIMQRFNLRPSPVVGILKAAIKDAILDGIIHNDYDEAYQFMLRKAAELGLPTDTQ